ncbi:integral membrane protein [Ophiostoma piceae UAMH 11346]|uniref:Integral membrane protein n=1 Tax=Ophiostoma piceae (strain UAMH 11346) TaxID=1262450 RepID=S3CR56_OPHP1|nr:integral membrane protein [Ophiostoma piceae UAMH 11346]
MSASAILTGLVGLEHVYILALEMFLWETPRGQRSFRLTPEFAKQTRSLAANMGLYNGFLAAGLFWGLLHPSPMFAFELKKFFLGCVSVAGLVGAVTSNKRILFIQFVPGSLALAATVLGF